MEHVPRKCLRARKKAWSDPSPAPAIVASRPHCAETVSEDEPSVTGREAGVRVSPRELVRPGDPRGVETIASRTCDRELRALSAGPCVPTADFVYLRFHGPGQLFASAYSNADLEPWARRVRDWLAAGRIVYAYFNNDFHAHAIANARTLLRNSVSG